MNFIKFEVDFGSGYSFLPRSQFEKLNIQNKLTPSNIVFRSDTQDRFVPGGKMQVNIMYNGQSSVEELYSSRCVFGIDRSHMDTTIKNFSL